MALISISTIVTSIVMTVVTAVAGVFCTPLFDSVKSCVEAMLDPRSLDDDCDKLVKLLTEIRAISGTEDINIWIRDAVELHEEIKQFWRQRVGGSSSSNRNPDHLSGCLCANSACSRCDFRRKLKDMITRGEMAKRLTHEEEISIFLSGHEEHTGVYLSIAEEGTTPQLHAYVGTPPCDDEIVMSNDIFDQFHSDIERIHDAPKVEDVTIAERTSKRVMDMLIEDDAWRIGLWGPGGVGKTTLVKALNAKLKSNSPFSLVRLIELTANDEQNNVRDAIAKSLKMDMRDEIEDQIRSRLQKEKFLLILDNVWSESIHLPSIGIPERQEGCKILLTTRFQRVCTKMKAKEIEMGYLTRVEARQLFAEKAGKVVNDERIKPLAKEVCDDCGYLPLSIVVVGSAMKGETNIEEWQNALDNLRSSVPIDVDIESKVYNPLKLGYDSLDDSLKACFLYCSLYPEGCYIEENELVQCWLAENLIDMGSNYTEAHNKGLSVIKKLKELCLLDQGVDGDNWEPQTVKMHDMVRDVARWIGKSMKRSIVFSGHGISRSPIVKLPKEIKDFQWIAFVENKAIILPKYEKDNSSVTTILLRGTNSEEDLQVSKEFLNSFRAVKVLNIEGVRSFVASLVQLKELHILILRNCSNIEELPNQNNLKVLVLSYSYIRSIPRGMKKLSNLKELDLSYTPCLENVHGHIIRNLNILEVLNMSGSGYRWPVKKRSGSEDATLQDLSELQWLREVYAQLAEVDGTYEEFIWMERLQRFFLAYNHPANRINDGKVFAINMEGKSIEVGSLILHADSLILHHIENVNEIFARASSTDQSKSKVKSLEIGKSGFGTSSTATIPEWLSLEILRVIDCPMLKKLSFMPSIKEIRGSIEWWETVEWDDEETKSLMNQHFISLD